MLRLDTLAVFPIIAQAGFTVPLVVISSFVQASKRLSETSEYRPYAEAPTRFPLAERGSIVDKQERTEF